MTDGSGETVEGGNLDRLQQLADTLNEVTAQLRNVAAFGHTTRRLAIGLIVSFVLDVLLTTGVTLLTVSALNQSGALHTSQLVACGISNQTRAEQQQLWVYIFQQAAPPKTAKERAAEQAFLAHVEQTFAPVNCAAVYRA